MKPLPSCLIRTALIALPALFVACGGGGFSATPANTPTPLPAASAPQAPSLTLTPAAIKTFHFSWIDVAGETEYRLLEDPDGASGYTRVATLPADTTQHALEVFLPERVNARYILQACNGATCADSAGVSAGGPLVEAVGYVKATQPANHDLFGTSMALSANGETLAVGAPGSGAGNGNRGTVHVFTRDGTSWRPQAWLEAPTPRMGDWFGFSIALSATGDTLAVGTPNDSRIAGNSGAVFVFTRSDNQWGPPQVVTGLNTGGGDLFGGSVALSGDGLTLAVGAENESGSAAGINGPDDNARAQSGAAYVFRRSGTSWHQQAYVKPSNPQMRAYFGGALALAADGRTLAVGASGEGSAVINSGAVYLFTHDGVTWSQQAQVKASNADTGTRYGKAIALSADGDVLAIGSEREYSSATGIDGGQNNVAAPSSGAVYVYARLGSVWSQQAYVKASNTERDDLFGYSVALSADGRSLAVGAYGEDSAARGIGGDQGSNGAYNGGAAYLFKNTATGWRQQAYVKASNTADGQVFRFGAALALSGNGQTLAVGCPYATNATAGVGGDQNDASGQSVGAAYLY